MKILTDENYEILKNSFLEHGFFAPFFIYRSPEGGSYIVDGHQRKKTLTRMDASPYKLPAIIVEADSMDAAVKLLLRTASQFGTVVEQGLKALAEKYGIEDWLPASTSFDKLFKPLPFIVDTTEQAEFGIAYKQQYGVIIICKDEVNQEEIYKRMMDEGYECKVVVT